MPVYQVEMRWRCSACQIEVLGRHKSCPQCGKPKNDEEFYSPSTPTEADAVTDHDLLALATAGPDWECQFCQNRQPDGKAACLGCGAPRHAPADGAPVPSGDEGSRPASGGPRRPATLDTSTRVATTLFFIGAGLLIALSWFLAPRFGPREVRAHVAERTWSHTVAVERYVVVDGAGFAEHRPADAFDVVAGGPRHHHFDQVLAGTKTETYTERVSCGQDCRTTATTCRSNKNGFQTCSGGDRVCSTRYCTQLRHRTVPRYDSVSVSAEWYAWRVWQWRPQRELEEHGTEELPTWPSDSLIALDAGCREGERERATRRAEYRVVFVDKESRRHDYQPRDAEEFRTLTTGATRMLRIGLFTPATIVGGDAIATPISDQ